MISAGTTNYFQISDLAISKNIITTGHIPNQVYHNSLFWYAHANTFINYPGSAIFFSFLSIVTGANNFSFANLPFISIIWVLIILCFIKLFLGKDMRLCLLLSLPITALTISAFPHIWTISYHSLGYLAHLLILYLLARNFLKQGQIDRSSYFLFFILFFLSLLTYYATSTFTITFLFALSLLPILFLRQRSARLPLVFPICSFILFFVLDIMVWRFIKKWQLDFGGIFTDLGGSLIRILTGAPSSQQLFAYGTLELGLFDTVIKYFYFFFICSYPIFIMVLALFTKTINRTNRTRLIIVLLATLSVPVVESFSYIMSTGSLNFRYLGFFTSIVTICISGVLLRKFTVKKKYVKKIIFIVCIFSMIFASIACIKLNVVNGAIEGLGYNKKVLVGCSEYNTLVTYASHNNIFYSNFQVSGELKMASLKIDANETIITDPFGEKIYSFYDALLQHDMKNITNVVAPGSIIVFTDIDSTKPLYGDAWGYLVPPLNTQDTFWFEETSNKIYSSGKIDALCIP